MFNSYSGGEQKLFDSIVDLNNPQSLIRQIKDEFKKSEQLIVDRVLDKENDRSLVKVVLDAVEQVSTELKKNHTIRSVITWGLLSVSTMLLILQGIFKLFG